MENKEGTVIISIQYFDNLRLMEKAIGERKILERNQSFGYSHNVNHYFMPTENEIIESAINQIKKEQAENDRLRNEIYVLKGDNAAREINKKREHKELKWWQKYF